MDYKDYKPMIQFLPHFLRDIKEYKALYTAYEAYMLDIGYEIQRMRLRTFYNDLDEAGCEMWEKVMGITPKAGSTIAERIAVIKATAKNEPPYTDETLESRLTILCGGADNYEITRDYPNYAISIKLALSHKHYLKVVKDLVKRIIPCNLIYDIGILYNQHEKIAQYTHNQLSNYTHAEIRESEEI